MCMFLHMTKTVHEKRDARVRFFLSINFNYDKLISICFLNGILCRISTSTYYFNIIIDGGRTCTTHSHTFISFGLSAAALNRTAGDVRAVSCCCVDIGKSVWLIIPGGNSKYIFYYYTWATEHWARPRRHYFLLFSFSSRSNSMGLLRRRNVKLTDWKIYLINDSKWIMAYWLLGTTQRNRKEKKNQLTFGVCPIGSGSVQSIGKFNKATTNEKEAVVSRRFIHWWGHCLPNSYAHQSPFYCIQ